MKIALIFFSGTNNTRYLTSIIKNKFINQGNEVKVFSILDKNINLEKYDLIGIGYPIYAFNSPKIVEKKIKKLKIKNKKYFIYKDSGEPYKLNNASSLKLTKILKHNEFLGEYHYVMPYNILFRTKNEFIRYELEYNYKYIDYMVKHVLDKKPYKPSLFNKFITFIFKIQRFGAWLNSRFYKVDKSKCIKCRKCQTQCPVNNVIYNKKRHKVVFHSKCIMCMKCAFSCPSNAIKIGLFNKIKVNGTYNFNALNQLENTYDFSNETEKFYKRFKPYFDYIDSLTKIS